MATLDWRKAHGEVIDDFLRELNQQTDRYILKGGTALAKCYELDRFSEDIDLDGRGEMIVELCKRYAEQRGYDCRVAKDTDTVKRCMLHYGGIKPLKVEMSARRKSISQSEVTKINGICVYTIDMLAMMKANAYQQRDKIRDLYDVTFIINHYYDELSSSTQFSLQNALQYKGIEHFDYIIHDQSDELIDVDVLAEHFLEAFEKTGLILENDELEEIKECERDEYEPDDDFER